MRPPFQLTRSFWPVFACLGAGMVLFECTPLDLWLQDHFYDFRTHQWIVDGNAPALRALFYQGPKVVLIAFAAVLLVLVLGPARWRAGLGLPTPSDRRALMVVLLTLATGPALIATGKATTNIFCPSEITRYGGDVAYVRVFESYPAGQRPVRRGRGFPAGHASGGFALLSLAALARTRRGQWIGIAVGLCAGSLMGIYQMLKGAHYLSHTFVTAAVTWLVFLLWLQSISLSSKRSSLSKPQALAPQKSSTPFAASSS